MDDLACLSFVQGLPYPALSERRGYHQTDQFEDRSVPPADKPRPGMTTAGIWDWMKRITQDDREAQLSRQDAMRAEFYRGRQ